MQAARRTTLTARAPRAPLLIGLALLVLVADAVSKALVVAGYRDPVTVVPHVLTLRLTRNPGAAFGVAGGATVLFSLVAVVVAVAVVRTLPRLRSAGWAVVLGLVLGGALGNLADRVFRAPGLLRGRVVDWIELPHWPVFNLADSAIVCGAVLAFVLAQRGIGLDGRAQRRT